MTLSDFRTINLVIDRANGHFFEEQFAKEGDYDGRRLVIQITNNGVVENLSHVDVNLGWKHDDKGNSGITSFERVDAQRGIFEVYYPKEMLHPGKVTAVIQIVDDGKITETKNFKIRVEGSSINAQSAVAEDSFTLLSEALIKVNKWNNDIETLVDDWDHQFREKYENVEENYANELNKVNAQLAKITTLIYPEMTQSDIQEKLSKGGHFRFVGGVHEVDLLFKAVDGYDSAFILESNTTIEFDENTSIQLKEHNSVRYYIFAVIDKENVTLNNIRLSGSRHLNSATSGEWGMGISLRGSNNIKLENITVDNCWGDGLYIGVSENQEYCKNVTVLNYKADNNRRQGISLISAINLHMKNLTLINTNGTPPADGLDIEPNKPTEFLQNIIIENVYTENNEGSGIKFYGGGFKGSVNPISITIKNHTDKNSHIGFRAREYLEGVKGFIKLENCKWENGSNHPFYAQNWSANGPRLEVFDSTSIWTGTESTGKYGFSISRENNTPDDNVLGNVHLYRPNLVIKEGATPPDRGIWLSPVYSASMANISIIDPIKLDASLTDSHLSVAGSIENFVVEDSYNVLRHSYTSNMGLSGYRYKRTVDNKGGAVGINFVLPSNEGVTITIVNEENHLLNVTTTDEKNILPLTNTGQGISSSIKGSSITLKNTSDGWVVLNMVGDWSAR